MNGLEKSQAFLAPETVLDWGIELRLWVATCVAGLSLFSVRALGLPLDEVTWSAIGVVFCSTLALYNLDGSLDAPERAAFFESAAIAKRRRLHLALTALSAGALLLLAAHLSTRALVLTVSGALACSLYAVPFPSQRRGMGAHRIAEPGAPPSPRLRLKSLPFLKAPFVGFAVGIATVWVPLWARDGSAHLLPALLLTLALSLYCTDNALLFDIVDLNEDRRAQVPTLPVRSGLLSTRRLSRALSLAGLLASGAFAATSAMPITSLGLAALGLTLAIFTELLHFGTSPRVVAWWVDGALLLPLGFQILVDL